MSDLEHNEHVGSPADGPPPIGRPLLLDDAGGVLVSSTTVQKASPLGLRAGLMAATLILGGAGMFAVNSALSAPAGPRTPEEAVTQLFEALDNEDLLGMAEVLLPSERASLVEPSVAIFSELQRLGVMEQEVDLHRLSYLDVEVEGLELTVTPVADGLAVVKTTGGTVTASGDGAVPLAERFGLGGGSWESGAVSLASQPATIAVVSEDGYWYASIYYSLGEAARAEVGGPVPVLGAGPVPVGAESPEALMAALVDRSLHLDAEGVIALVDPVEARALYDYSYLFLDDLDRAADDLRGMLESQQLSWSVDGPASSTSEVNGRTLVQIDNLDLRVQQGGAPMADVTFDGNCVMATLDGAARPDDDTQQYCANELIGVGGSDAGRQFWTGAWTVVERDGRWYLSVVSSLLAGVNDGLVSLEPADIDAMVDGLDALVGGFGGIAQDLGSGLGADALSTEEDAMGGSFLGADETDGGQGFEVEDSPIDPMVVPEGAEAWGADPYFSEVTTLGIDTIGAIATDLMDDDGAYVSVITMPSPDFVAETIRSATEDWGYSLVRPADLPAGLPDGTQMIDMGDGFTLYLYDRYAISTYLSEDADLAVRVLTRVANG